MKRVLLSALFVFGLSAASFAESGSEHAAMSKASFKGDAAHSYIGFEVSHLMVSKTRGEFTDYDIQIKFNEKKPEESTVSVTIKADSVDTKIAKRDGHIRSADFFDTEKHPNITFKSTSIKSKGDKKYEVTGDFTLRGVTKKITFPATYRGQVTDPYGNTRIGFEAKVTIDRRDYGVAWSSKTKTGELVAGYEVDIIIDFEAIKE